MITSKLKIEQEESMETYRDEVLNNIGISPNDFFSSLYASGGISYGRDDGRKLLLDVFLPSLILSKDNFALTEMTYFDSFRLSIQFPIN